MALQDYALTDVATMEDELALDPGTATARLERLIHQASEAIRSYCRRPLHYQTATETHAGTGRPKLYLDLAPIVSVDAVACDGAAVEDYTVEDAEAGLLWRDGGWSVSGWANGWIAQGRAKGAAQRSWSVTLTGGYVTPAQATSELPRTLPHDLEAACVETVRALYHRQGRDPSVVSEKLGDYSVSYSGTNAAIGRGEGGIIPDAVLPSLARYRRLR